MSAPPLAERHRPFMSPDNYIPGTVTVGGDLTVAITALACEES